MRELTGIYLSAHVYIPMSPRVYTRRATCVHRRGNRYIRICSNIVCNADPAVQALFLPTIWVKYSIGGLRTDDMYRLVERSVRYTYIVDVGLLVPLHITHDTHCYRQQHNLVQSFQAYLRQHKLYEQTVRYLPQESDIEKEERIYSLAHHCGGSIMANWKTNMAKAFIAKPSHIISRALR